MDHYFSQPDIHSIGFHYPSHAVARQELRSCIKAALARNPSEEFLLLCDYYGSTAFNETALLCKKLHLEKQSLLLCGVNLPMDQTLDAVFQFHENAKGGHAADYAAEGIPHELGHARSRAAVKVFCNFMKL